jgi:hypothetical protein
MTGHITKLKGYRIKDGKVVKVHGFGLDASARIRQKKSKRVRPVKRGKT